MKGLLALLFGLLFGAGLAVSGMTSPDKVIGFLDIAGIADGTWDPSLAFVMGGAVLTGLPLFARARSQGGGGCGLDEGGEGSGIDAKLLLGSAVFGAGWGLGGICPGPGIVALPIAPIEALAFCAAMAAGLLASRLFDRKA